MQISILLSHNGGLDVKTNVTPRGISSPHKFCGYMGITTSYMAILELNIDPHYTYVIFPFVLLAFFHALHLIVTKNALLAGICDA